MFNRSHVNISRDYTPKSLLLYVHATYMVVVHCKHPICGESHIQRNANGEVATGTDLFSKV